MFTASAMGDTASDEVSIGSAWFVTDAQHAMSVEHFTTPPSDARDPNANPHLGYTLDAVWLVTELHNHSAQPQTRIQQFENPFLGRIDSYIVRAHEPIPAAVLSGATTTIAERQLITRLPSVSVTLAPGETVRLINHVRSHGSISLKHDFFNQTEFYTRGISHSFWLTAYFGMLLALALYNLLLFAGLKDRVFALYSCFVFSFGLAAASFNGLGSLILWQNHPLDSVRITAIAFTLSAFLGVLFTQSFLHTALFSARWHRYLQLLAGFSFIGVLGAATLPTYFALQLMDVVGLVVCISILVCGVYCAMHRVPGARIFVLAWSLLLIGASAFALRNLGVLPSNTFTLYGLQFGSALEMLLLSFALVARFNKLKRQKEAAQARMLQTLKQQEALLEEKVAQRTRELENMASTDMLTGLLNRNGMAKHMQALIKRQQRRLGKAQSAHTGVTLFMLDLDGFKPINDIYGHDAGDIVLKEVAQRLQKTARGNDCVARFGGDEFIIIAEQDAPTDEAQQQAFMHRLCDVVSQPIMLNDGTEVQVGVSIGCSSAQQAIDIDSLFRQADSAMYDAKRQKEAC